MNKPVTITIKNEYGQPKKTQAQLKWITHSQIDKKFDTCGVEIVKGHTIIAMLNQVETN